MTTNPSQRFKRLLGLALGLAIVLAALAIVTHRMTRQHEQKLATESMAELQDEAKRSPTDARVFWHLARRAGQKGQNALETEAWAKAAALEVDNESVWLNWAHSTENEGDAQKAFGILTLFLHSYPRSARAHLALATLCAQKQMAARAYDEALVATRLTPDDADAWRLAGTQAQTLKRYSDAEAAMRQSLLKQPDDWHSHTGLGNALVEQNRFAEAQTCYRQAIRLAPGEATPLIASGALLLNHRNAPADWEQAYEALKKATTLAPDNAYAYLLLAQCCEQQSRWTEAQQVLERAQQLAPYSPEVVYEKARVAQRLGDGARSKSQFQRHDALLRLAAQRRALMDQRENFKKHPDLLLKLARLYSATGDFEQASDCYRLIIQDKLPDAAVATQELHRLAERQQTQSSHLLK